MFAAHKTEKTRVNCIAFFISGGSVLSIGVKQFFSHGIRQPFDLSQDLRLPPNTFESIQKAMPELCIFHGCRM